MAQDNSDAPLGVKDKTQWLTGAFKSEEAEVEETVQVSRDQIAEKMKGLQEQLENDKKNKLAKGEQA
eukprot:scaffold602287_cov35-Attheya_sp.AAC.1